MDYPKNPVTGQTVFTHDTALDSTPYRVPTSNIPFNWAITLHQADIASRYQPATKSTGGHHPGEGTGTVDSRGGYRGRWWRTEVG